MLIIVLKLNDVFIKIGGHLKMYKIFIKFKNNGDVGSGVGSLLLCSFK